MKGILIPCKALEHGEGRGITNSITVTFDPMLLRGLSSLAFTGHSFEENLLCKLGLKSDDPLSLPKLSYFRVGASHMNVSRRNEDLVADGAVEFEVPA